MTHPDIDNSVFARNAWIRALQRTASIERDPANTLPVLLDSLALRFDAAPALVSREASLTYRQLALRCRAYAHWGLEAGLAAGDVVALLMPTGVDYLAAWLGLTRIGATVALVNTQLTGDALRHSLAAVAPTLVLVDAEFAAAVAAVRVQLPATLQVREPDTAALAAMSALAAVECAPPTLDAPALYIYTSGTTGLPKAAKVSHFRLLQWTEWFAGLLDTQPEDRMYNCLPLYHSVGGVVACGATLLGGGAVILRRRFSASDFWRDVCAERCTLFQYIGELCRYLVNAPVQPMETAHALKVACGNGLGADVWETFKTRFRIPRILEYYAATEGNVSLYNCEGRPGAIGRIPPFLAHRQPVRLLRVEGETQQPLRSVAGLCEPCAVDEVGEAVGFIPTGAQRLGRFEGYTDGDASAAKVLHDVVQAGDSWYRTGDLMRRDAQGFYYFVDRIGDTFRWKGENVSTTQVLQVLRSAPGVRDGSVYGVAVPGADGRAGMAALVVDAAFDAARLREHMAERLPAYARPVFLRLVPALEATGTFKPIKHELVRAGCDPGRSADPLYVDDPKVGAYRRLDADLYARIAAGEMRL